MDKTKEIIIMATEQLKNWDESATKVTDDQMKRYYEKLSHGLCPICNKTLKVSTYEVLTNGVRYRYNCGHSHTGILLADTLNIRESFGIKMKRIGFGMLKKIFNGYKPSGDPKLPKGVNIEMVVDREHNEYYQKVIDLNTGKTTHEEHETLVEHSNKQKDI